MTNRIYPDPCPRTGRRVVTVAQWAARPDELVDEHAYWFDPEGEERGADPWRLVEGADAHMRGEGFDVLFANGTYRIVTGEQFIYVRPAHWALLQLRGVI